MPIYFYYPAATPVCNNCKKKKKKNFVEANQIMEKSKALI